MSSTNVHPGVQVHPGIHRADAITDKETQLQKGLVTQLVRKYKFVNELSREHVCPGFQSTTFSNTTYKLCP